MTDSNESDDTPEFETAAELRDRLNDDDSESDDDDDFSRVIAGP